MQLSPYGLLLLTQPLQSSEQHIRANLEFSSNLEFSTNFVGKGGVKKSGKTGDVIYGQYLNLQPFFAFWPHHQKLMIFHWFLPFPTRLK